MWETGAISRRHLISAAKKLTSALQRPEDHLEDLELQSSRLVLLHVAHDARWLDSIIKAGEHGISVAEIVRQRGKETAPTARERMVQAG